MIAPAVETRFCEHCVSLKPLTEFRRRCRNGTDRLSQCRACHNATERERRVKKRELQDRRSMAASLTKLKNARTSDQIELLVRVMCVQYGGVQGIVAAWMKYQEYAKRQSGGFAGFRCMQAVLRLLQYCEENQPDPGDMTDEELRQAMVRDIKQLIRQHPELAVAAASEIGWTVIPLAES